MSAGAPSGTLPAPLRRVESFLAGVSIIERQGMCLVFYIIITFVWWLGGDSLDSGEVMKCQTFLSLPSRSMDGGLRIYRHQDQTACSLGSSRGHTLVFQHLSSLVMPNQRESTVERARENEEERGQHLYKKSLAHFFFFSWLNYYTSWHYRWVGVQCIFRHNSRETGDETKAATNDS